MDTAEFSFVSLDPGPWSSASSRNNSPRGSMKHHHHHLHRPLSSSRGPDVSQPSTPVGSEGGSLTACDLAIIAGGISKHGSTSNTARPQSPHAQMHPETTPANSHGSLPQQAPVSTAHNQGGHESSVSCTAQEQAELGPEASRASVATSTFVQGQSLAAPAGYLHHQRQSQATGWRPSTLNRQRTDVVDHLIEQYHQSSALSLHMHLKTQKHIGQLRQYQQLQGRLQAAQAAMFASLDSAQWAESPEVQEAPPHVSTMVQQAELANARKGSGSPSVPRFHSSAIMQDGMYVASGDTAFAASPGIKHTPSASLLFERYANKDSDVPSLHRYYFRPQQRPPKAQPQFASIPRRPFSTRTLPNGIPVSRLHTEAARRATSNAHVQAALQGAGDSYRNGYTGSQYLTLQTDTGRSATAGSSAAAMDAAMQDALGAIRSPSQFQGSSSTPSCQQPDAETSTSAALAALGAAGQLGSATAEPLLDDPFAELVKAHFHELAEQQTQRLQKRLNAGLPVLLQSMGVSSEAMTTR